MHGKAGERFLYLTWGMLDGYLTWGMLDGYLTWGMLDGDVFTMFRRAKLMLDEAPQALDEGRALVASVSLTDEKGQPRCARVRAPAIAWTVE